MSYNRRDVTFGLDKVFHHLRLINATEFISVDNRADIKFDLAFCSARFVVNDFGVCYVVLNAQDSDDVFLAKIFTDNTYLIYPPFTHGIGAGGSDIAMLPNGETYIYNTRKDQIGIDVFNLNGILLNTLNVPYASKGINYIDDNYNPVMSNDYAVITKVIDGITLNNCCERSGFIIGEISIPADGLMLINPNGSKFWYQFSEQIAPRLAIGNGIVLAGLSGQDSPNPYEIVWQPYPNGNPIPIPQPPTEQIIHVKTGDVLKIIVD